MKPTEKIFKERGSTDARKKEKRGGEREREKNEKKKRRQAGRKEGES